MLWNSCQFFDYTHNLFVYFEGISGRPIGNFLRAVNGASISRDDMATTNRSLLLIDTEGVGSISLY